MVSIAYQIAIGTGSGHQQNACDTLQNRPPSDAQGWTFASYSLGFPTVCRFAGLRYMRCVSDTCEAHTVSVWSRTLGLGRGVRAAGGVAAKNRYRTNRACTLLP